MNDPFAPLHGREGRLRAIVSGLSPVERETLHRFYMLGEEAAVISQDLGIAESELRELRTRVRSKFLAGEQPQ
jgi:DNA-directed RNA polymerase specialized sigma24 family protein